MNAVAKTTSTALASTALASLKQGISNVQSTLVRASANPYLRMLRDGGWVYGQEDIEVEPGSIWAANPLSIMHGWVAWKRAKNGEKVDNSDGPLGEVMVNQNQPLPAKETLANHGDDAPWKYQMSIEFKCLTGTDKGEQVLYKASSVGATKVMDDLVKAIFRQVDDPEGRVVAAIRFDNSTYQHKEYGRTYEPVFDIVEWYPLTDAMPEIKEPAKDPAPQTEAAPKARTRTVPATKPTDASQTAAPKGELSLEELEAMIIAKKLAADKAKAQPAADETRPLADEEKAAVQRAELLAELNAMDGTQAAQPAQAQAEAPATGQPMRRRRNA